MGNPLDQTEDLGASGSWRPGPDRVHAPPGATRRALLALGGLLAGTKVALGAADGVPRRSSATVARLKLAQSALDLVRANIGRGQFGPGERDPIAVWSRRRFEARLELASTKNERVEAAREHLEEMKGLEQLLGKLHKAGEVDQMTYMDAQYRCLEAESWLDREDAKS